MTLSHIVTARDRRGRHRRRTIAALVALIAFLSAAMLMLGHSYTPPGDVIRVLLGHDVPGASFTVGQLRPPRALLCILSGLCFGLGVALAIYGLSLRGGVAGARLILVGIGVASMLQSFIDYPLSRAPAWDLQQAMRWLSGSVNGAQMAQVLPARP